jgi:hypothetical protein
MRIRRGCGRCTALRSDELHWELHADSDRSTRHDRRTDDRRTDDRCDDDDDCVDGGLRGRGGTQVVA